MKDQATALVIIFKLLDKDNQVLIDNYPTAKEFWAKLKEKYSTTDLVTASTNIAAIQGFKFEQAKSIIAV